MANLKITTGFFPDAVVAIIAAVRKVDATAVIGSPIALLKVSDYTHSGMYRLCAAVEKYKCALISRYGQNIFLFTGENPQQKEFIYIPTHRVDDNWPEFWSAVSCGLKASLSSHPTIHIAALATANGDFDIGNAFFAGKIPQLVTTEYEQFVHSFSETRKVFISLGKAKEEIVGLKQDSAKFSAELKKVKEERDKISGNLESCQKELQDYSTALKSSSQQLDEARETIRTQQEELAELRVIKEDVQVIANTYSKMYARVNLFGGNIHE